MVRSVPAQEEPNVSVRPLAAGDRYISLAGLWGLSRLKPWDDGALVGHKVPVELPGWMSARLPRPPHSLGTVIGAARQGSPLPAPPAGTTAA